MIVLNPFYFLSVRSWGGGRSRQCCLPFIGLLILAGGREKDIIKLKTLLTAESILLKVAKVSSGTVKMDDELRFPPSRLWTNLNSESIVLKQILQGI